MTSKNISTPAAMYLHDKQTVDEMETGGVTMCLLIHTCIDEMTACISELAHDAALQTR